MASIDPGEFKFTKGELGQSPTFYVPATDRDKAIGRLQMMAGDPSLPAECEEQEQARVYLRQIIREDPELRHRLKFWKQYVDAPNGRERLFKEIVLPKMMEQMRFGRSAQQNYDWWNDPISSYYKKDVCKDTSQYVMSPWYRGMYYQYSDASGLWNKFVDRGWLYAIVGAGLFFWSRGWYVRHFGSGRCIEQIKRAKHSRRYYGRGLPTLPNPAMFVRNQMVLQAITRKMIRDGKAHNLHVQQALNVMKPQ
mmetsp:Transcript_15339/g.23329  ORF Transcript_15339/g.23329 Transcript_15339/m.23329 type:complete len:251 (-) Transcript_15339:223-975(-)|eukprot:CAMPEP_0202700152 /NCGR_PEP_ID=MMETSP1385-20130828/13361_1 /ASSEMBLY_ACC=CAM_ASM_000861 /TAXON_ID=933848 /ORGANISM="Elphidium margaritaceum" /LENGTH=250 /DNA_ID=CAMNT_0049357279 /DNA_START=40 /DNA_END=792 /DNA_ORIENTATION=-